VLAWARGSDIRTIVISASPLPIVEEAAALWGFEPRDLVAAQAGLEQGRFAAQLAAPVPYGTEKVLQGRARMGDAAWLGSFADNVYDLEMLREARVGVAVRPKMTLRQRLLDEPGIVLLE
jgi:phosphoserine phosphatase